MGTSSTTAGGTAAHGDDEFDGLAAAVRKAAAEFPAPYFIVDAPDLFRVYLGAFAERAQRQVHDCHACKRFLQQYGALVAIDDRGHVTSLFWNELAERLAPPMYRPSVRALREAIEYGRVVSVHHSAEARWGSPHTYDAKRGHTWSHFDRWD